MARKPQEASPHASVTRFAGPVENQHKRNDNEATWTRVGGPYRWRDPAGQGASGAWAAYDPQDPYGLLSRRRIGGRTPVPRACQSCGSNVAWDGTTGTCRCGACNDGCCNPFLHANAGDR